MKVISDHLFKMEGHSDWPALWRCVQHNRSVTEDRRNNEMCYDIQFRVKLGLLEVMDKEREAVRLIYSASDRDYAHYRGVCQARVIQKDRKFVQNTRKINCSPPPNLPENLR